MALAFVLRRFLIKHNIDRFVSNAAGGQDMEPQYVPILVYLSHYPIIIGGNEGAFLELTLSPKISFRVVPHAYSFAFHPTLYLLYCWSNRQLAQRHRPAGAWLLRIDTCLLQQYQYTNDSSSALVGQPGCPNGIWGL
jgi:hypothetical protein